MATTEGELTRAGFVIEEDKITLTRALEVSEDLIIQGSLTIGAGAQITGNLRVSGTITGTVQSAYCLQLTIADVLSLTSYGHAVVPSVGAGSITKVWTVLQGDIGASGASIATKINGVDISATDEHDVVIADAAIAGDVDSKIVPVGTHAVVVGDVVSVVPVDAGTNAVAVQVLVEITMS